MNISIGSIIGAVATIVVATCSFCLAVAKICLDSEIRKVLNPEIVIIDKKITDLYKDKISKETYETYIDGMNQRFDTLEVLLRDLINRVNSHNGNN